MKLQLFMLGAALVLATSCVSKKNFDALQAEKDALDQQLQDVTEKVGMLEEQNAQLNSDKDQLGGEIESLKGDLSSTQTQLTDVEKSVADKQNQINELRTEISTTFDDVESAVEESNMRLNEMENMLYVDFGDTIEFSTASARVSADDEDALMKISNMLKANPQLHFIVEGHADKRAINTDKYSDNWDLSAARSIAVVRKLIDMGVEPTQLTAAGRAEFAPVAEGEDKESLEANRRTELIAIPNIGKLYKFNKKGS